MQSIRTILWVIFAVAITVFALSNAGTTQVNVWPGYIAEMPLSVLILGVFALGFLPPFIVALGNRWRLQRRIAQQEQTIAALRPVQTQTPPIAQPAPAIAPDLAVAGPTSTDRPL
jgi:lipopolysaccharide assembly protein A